MYRGKPHLISRLGSGFLFCALGLAPSAAFADRIDGDWCSQTGQRLNIDGQHIVTPGGTKMSGIYERHSFSYLIPLPETNAGSRIEMSQQNEETMLLRRQGDKAGATAIEIWKRCDATS